jgi:hypothetical protein
MNAETQPRPKTAAPEDDTQGFHLNYFIAHAHVPNRDHRDQPAPAPQPSPGIGGGGGMSGLLPPLQQK